jgi:ABC-2 type transport system ATP-binding protein
MIYSGKVDAFVRQFTQTTVVVRTPDPTVLAEALRRAGADVDRTDDGGLRVSGLDAPAIGELAHRDGVVLHELATQHASLETAFISATGASEEYVARGVEPALTEAATPGGAA